MRFGVSGFPARDDVLTISRSLDIVLVSEQLSRKLRNPPTFPEFLFNHTYNIDKR